MSSDTREGDRLARKIFSVQRREVCLDLDALQIESVLEVVNFVHHLVEHVRIVDLDQVDVRGQQRGVPERNVDLLMPEIGIKSPHVDVVMLVQTSLEPGDLLVVEFLRLDDRSYHERRRGLQLEQLAHEKSDQPGGQQGNAGRHLGLGHAQVNQRL